VIRALAPLTALAALAALAPPALAGGMILPVKGVRDVERAGALVAGAEDADSLWLNPAGLAHLAKTRSLLVGVTYVNQQVDYARIDSGGNQMEPISNQYPGIGIPTLAAAFGLGDKLVLAAGITAPYSALHRYEIEGTQRYSSISLAQSASVLLAFGVAYQVTPQLRVGATLQNAVTDLRSRVVLSGCPGQTVCAPEDPEFDADTKVEQLDLISPTGSLGVQYEVKGQLPKITLGAMVQAPSKVSGEGKITTKLPSSGFYEGAVVVGDRASIEMTMPAMVRLGVEVRPLPQLRVEAALDVELWSMHDELTITPKDVRIENVAGVGTYEVGPATIPRNYRNSYAPAIGGEYELAPNARIGAGYSYETAAAPKGYVSVLTVDSAKHLVGLGGSYHRGGWVLGASLGFVKLTDVDVSLDEAKVPQLTPVRGQPSDVMVNAGSYRSSYLLGGLRFSTRF
jgi:long-chain fatty acid transport protein